MNTKLKTLLQQLLQSPRRFSIELALGVVFFKRWCLACTTGLLFIAMIAVGCKASKPKRVSAEKTIESNDSMIIGDYEDFQLEDMDRNLIQKENAFSLKLFQKVAAGEKKSTFISTIGILYSLNVMNMGASGASRQEICNALGVDSTDLERMNTLSRRMIKGHVKMQEDDLPGLSSNLLTGCALFVKSGVDISKSFTHNFEDYYLGQIIQGDFDNKMQSEIDEWCSNQSDNKITHLPVDHGASSVLAVINCFNGKWEKEFSANQTKEEPFSDGRVKTVMMMNDEDDDRRLSYAQRSDYSLLRIPYRGGYAMYVVLPKRGKNLSSVIHKLSMKELQNAIDNLSHYDIIYLKLPKFELNFNCITNKWLTSMGIRKVFSRDADFGNVNREFYLDRISQYAKVKVDEIGTAAEALTSAVLKVKEMGAVEEKSVVYFYADHPFAYIIADPFGNYCFMGTFWGN
jgi:serpin B